MFLTLLAQESSSGGGLVAFLPFILIAVVMYFLLIRPQRRRMQQQRELASAVEEGDEVMTTSGIYGFVTATEGDVIWLEIADGVDIRVARQAVSRRIPVSEGRENTPRTPPPTTRPPMRPTGPIRPTSRPKGSGTLRPPTDRR